MSGQRDQPYPFEILKGNVFFENDAVGFSSYNKYPSKIYDGDGDLKKYIKSTNTFSVLLNIFDYGITKSNLINFTIADKNSNTIYSINYASNMSTILICNVLEGQVETFSVFIPKLENFAYVFIRNSIISGFLNVDRIFEFIILYSQFIMKKGMKYNIDCNSYLNGDLVLSNNEKEITEESDSVFYSVKNKFNGLLKF